MNIPSEFIPHMNGVAGWQADAFCKVQDGGEQVHSIRVNPLKIADHTLLDFEPEARVPWTSTGYYLPSRPRYTLDPFLHAGAYYVQEASSMFLEQAIQQSNPATGACHVLDLCAAPGGKSTHLLSLLGPDAVLVSNEVIKSRVSILEENLVKWGNSNQLITNNDPRDFTKLGPLFDIILVDAPCSGSGLFRRDPKAMEEWSPELVDLCAQRQKRILADIWPCLKENGVLIYSTCSYSRQENEEVVDWIMAEQEAASLPMKLNPSWGIVESISPARHGWGYRFFPDQLRGEGLFMAVFRKQSTTFSSPVKKGKIKLERAGRQPIQNIQEWIKPGWADFFLVQENMVGMPPVVADLLAALSSMYVRRAGLTLGKWAGKQLIPDHALALSGMLAPDAVHQIALNKEAAIAFLRKDEVHIEGSTPGWNLVKYNGLGLGWMKVLANRSNNYYPKEWRILMQNTP